MGNQRDTPLTSVPIHASFSDVISTQLEDGGPPAAGRRKEAPREKGPEECATAYTDSVDVLMIGERAKKLTEPRKIC